MTNLTPRELLAQADEQRRVANGADGLMAVMRLGYNPATKRGLLGRPKAFTREPEWVPVDRDVAAAIYRAAGIVKSEALQRSRELEAQVTTEVGQ